MPTTPPKPPSAEAAERLERIRSASATKPALAMRTNDRVSFCTPPTLQVPETPQDRSAKIRKVGGVQKETRSFVRIANAGFVADADLMRSRRSAASALGGLGGVVGMVSLAGRVADGVYGARGGVGAAFTS